jgi:hypothetical protein
MSDCVRGFNKFKKQMDEKTFDYNKPQKWEAEIEESINNYSFEKFVNDVYMVFQTDNQSEPKFDDI